MGKQSANQKRLWRLAYAAALAGLGYAYHALSQGRSVRSKMLHDGHKLAQFKDYWQDGDLIKEELIREAKDLGDGLLSSDQAARYNMDLKQTLAGAYYEMISPARQKGPALIYWHGGKRVQAVSDREWYFLKQLVDRLQVPCYIPIIQPLALSHLNEEVDRLTALVQDILVSEDLPSFNFLASDSGALFALALVPRFKEPLERQVLLSPWLAAPSESTEESLEDQAIKSLFDTQAASRLLDQTDFSQVAPTRFIVGTADSEQASSLKTYQRLRAKAVPSQFYRFDLMAADFYLYPMPEQEEVMELLEESL